jgi:hypothetical protein
MQPYFFPYIGYFQLIHAVDTYVNLDHVSFMKRSYMTRNIIKNNISINIPVSGGSQNKTCKQVTALCDQIWFNKFLITLDQNYKNEKYYDDVLKNIIHPWKNTIINISEHYGPISISEFNFAAIYYVCDYLNMHREFHVSRGITTEKKNKGLQDIVKHFGGSTYINAIGGQELYSKENFASQGIELKFIKMGNVDFKNPYVSILDLLFTYPKQHIISELQNYELI